MADSPQIQIANVQKIYRTPDREGARAPTGHRSRRLCGRVRGELSRALRLRQVDPAQRHRRILAHRRAARSGQRQTGDGSRPGSRHMVFQEYALPVDDRRAEHRIRHGDPGVKSKEDYTSGKRPTSYWPSLQLKDFRDRFPKELSGGHAPAVWPSRACWRWIRPSAHVDGRAVRRAGCVGPAAHAAGQRNSSGSGPSSRRPSASSRTESRSRSTFPIASSRHDLPRPAR